MPAPRSTHAANDRPLPVRTRGDLQVVEVAFASQPTFVVKDPVTGDAFHLTAEEHALLEALRQPASLKSLSRVIESHFAPRRAPVVQLQQFVNQLYDQGLLIGDNPGQGGQLLDRGQERARRGRWAGWLQILSIRLGGVDAHWFVDRLYRAVGWLCSTPVLVAFALFTLAAAAMAVGHSAELAARMPAIAVLAQPRWLPVWLAAVIGVKVLHELGHAVACRHFGAQPQEIGVLLLAGVPSLYCDVTDAWRLPSKWQRMAVSSAGMLVELVIASVAVVVWRLAEPGMLTTICLSLIVVCSVGTLLVNANPLLRYDGYYLLSDWLEVPNLADRARGLVSSAWRRWLLGEPTPADPLLGPHKRRALWVYAILSKLYLAVVLAGLLVVMLKLARPYYLQNAVYAAAAIVVAGLALRPIAAAGKLLANPAARSRFRWVRLGIGLTVLGAIIAGAALWPVTRRVTAPLVIVPAKSHPLFAVAAGELTFASPSGSTVAAGDVVARLHNPQLEQAIAKQAAAVREHEVRLEHLRLVQATLPTAQRLLPAAVAELADARAQLAEQQAMAEALVIRAPAAGRVLPPPERERDDQADKLGAWHGSPLEARNLGAWIEPGTALAVIAEPGSRVAWAGVDQADVPVLKAGQAVRVVAEQATMTILEGRVLQVARNARPLRRSTPGGDWRPENEPPRHLVEISLDDWAAELLPAARGTAKIAVNRSTLGAIVLHELRQTFQRAF